MSQLIMTTVKSENGLTTVVANRQLLNVKRMLDVAANGTGTMIGYDGGNAPRRILINESYASLAAGIAAYLTKTPEIATTGKGGNKKALTLRMISDTVERVIEDVQNAAEVSGITGANATDNFTLPSGSLVAGARIRFSAGSVSGFTLDTDYWVINPVGLTFQIAATPGGAAIVLSADLTGLKAKIYQKSVISVIPSLGMSEVKYSTDKNLVEVAAIFNA